MRYSAAMMKLSVVTTIVCLAAATARADRKAIADSLTKLATSAAELSASAKSSDDRGARKKFAPAAQDLADDLTALSKRVVKDVAFKVLGKEAAELDTSSAKLVELADEDDDKDERKALRARAQSLQQGIAGVRAQLDAGKDEGDGATAPQRFTGALVNNSDACSWAENLKFVVSRDGRDVFASQLVFPGKQQALVLDKGRYLVRGSDASGKQLVQKTIDVDREGWQLKSGCVNQD